MMFNTIKYLTLIIIIFFNFSCGFSPIYSEKNKEFAEILNNIKVIADYDNLKLRHKIILQEIKQFFITRDNIEPEFYIKISNVNSSQSATNLNRVGETSEYSYRISLTATVFDRNHKKIIKKNFVENENYRVNNNYYASQIKKDTIRQALTKQISRNIKEELILVIKKHILEGNG